VKGYSRDYIQEPALSLTGHAWRSKFRQASLTDKDAFVVVLIPSSFFIDERNSQKFESFRNSQKTIDTLCSWFGEVIPGWSFCCVLIDYFFSVWYFCSIFRFFGPFSRRRLHRIRWGRGTLWFRILVKVCHLTGSRVLFKVLNLHMLPVITPHSHQIEVAMYSRKHCEMILHCLSQIPKRLRATLVTEWGQM